MKDFIKVVIVIFVSILVIITEMWLPEIPSWLIIVVAAIAYYLWKGSPLFHR